MTLPPVHRVRRADTRRLIPSKYLDKGDSVLTLIADSPEHLEAIFELDAATNDRLRAEAGGVPGIAADELLAGVPHAAVVNATFCHAHPLGSRFNGPARGALYAAFALETAQAEVAFHKSVELAEIGSPDESVTYDDTSPTSMPSSTICGARQRFAPVSRPTATLRPRRSPRRCSIRDRSASSFRACGTRPGRASPVSARRS